MEKNEYGADGKIYYLPQPDEYAGILEFELFAYNTITDRYDIRIERDQVVVDELAERSYTIKATVTPLSDCDKNYEIVAGSAQWTFTVGGGLQLPGGAAGERLNANLWWIVTVPVIIIVLVIILLIISGIRRRRERK